MRTFGGLVNAGHVALAAPPAIPFVELLQRTVTSICAVTICVHGHGLVGMGRVGSFSSNDGDPL